MSLELCILASGSAGNCSVIRSPAGAVLVDLGIGPRTCAQRLDGTGTTLADIGAVCLTHLDADHFKPHWAATLIKRGIRVFCHEDRKPELMRLVDPKFGDALANLVHTFDGGPFQPLWRREPDTVEETNIDFCPIPLAHDEAGSHGFVVAGFGCRIGYATDLGRVPSHLLDAFANLDILAIESNYDPEMQLASSRPAFLKQRIMGGRGHLSNEQSLRAVRQILDRQQAAGRALPGHIVLLHRSRQCNCPNLLRRLFESDPRIAARLTLAEQYSRSEWLRARDVAPAAGEQLTLLWSFETNT